MFQLHVPDACSPPCLALLSHSAGGLGDLAVQRSSPSCPNLSPPTPACTQLQQQQQQQQQQQRQQQQQQQQRQQQQALPKRRWSLVGILRRRTSQAG